MSRIILKATIHNSAVCGMPFQIPIKGRYLGCVGWVCLSLALVACSASPKTKTVTDPSRVSRTQEMTLISIRQADLIIKEHLIANHLPWGEPTLIRNAPNRYIYNFATPEQEAKSKGPRRLVIDIRTGKVSFPTQSGGDFSK